MTRRRTVLSLTVVVSLFAMGCALFSSSGAGSTASTAEYEALLAAPADPLPLDIQLSDGNAASALMASDGGTLTATGPDGTKYTLEVPAGALYAPTQITMIPSAEVRGLPFGGAPRSPSSSSRKACASPTSPF